MKLIVLVLLGLLLTGCSPTTEPQAAAPAVNQVVNDRAALQAELDDLIARRNTAQETLKDMDERGVKAGKEGDREVAKAATEIYIPICEKLLDIQNKIDAIDAKLGTNSNTKYSETEKSEKTMLLNQYISDSTKEVEEIKADLEKAKNDPKHSIPLADYEQLIRYGEVKIKLWNKQLEKLK